jgi:hypothetical protein
VKIINKTDNVIDLWIDDKWETIMPTGISARLDYEKKDIGDKHGISYKSYTIKEVKNLPARAKDTVIIADFDVCQYVWKASCREDVCCLDNPVVRNDRYQTLASMSLLCYNEILLKYCI